MSYGYLEIESSLSLIRDKLNLAETKNNTTIEITIGDAEDILEILEGYYRYLTN